MRPCPSCGGSVACSGGCTRCPCKQTILFGLVAIVGFGALRVGYRGHVGTVGIAGIAGIVGIMGAVRALWAL